KSLATNLVLKMGKVLNIKDEELREYFENGFQSMGMNYYPPCPQPEKVVGLTTHSDDSVLTILLEINEVEGLQIKKDGKWIPVTPFPNAFVVNIGVVLEIVTNGTYRSIEHRVIVNSIQGRLSIGTVYLVIYDGEMYPTSNLVSENNPLLFKRVTVEEYFRNLCARKLRGKSPLDALRIEHVQD
ncbi:protein SRG1-like, partial [Citrus sinensis]|uniref:protein SRG1-like n=1 Tax=Citrus sinensis TaxID=2711 RepID=UPI0022791340